MSPDCIAGSSVQLVEVTCVLKLSAGQLLVLLDRRLRSIMKRLNNFWEMSVIKAVMTSLWVDKWYVTTDNTGNTFCFVFCFSPFVGLSGNFTSSSPSAGNNHHFLSLFNKLLIDGLFPNICDHLTLHFISYSCYIAIFYG